MSLPVISNTYRCALNFNNTFSASPPKTVNVLHVRTVTEDEAGIANSINDALQAATQNPYGNGSSVFELQLVQVTKLDGSSGAVDTTVSGFFMGTGGDYIPQGAQVISLKTGARGPQGRGRVYIGPIAETQNENGALLDTSSSVSGWEDVQADLAGGGIELVVASYVHSVARTVVGISSRPFLRTQRRRAVG